MLKLWTEVFVAGKLERKRKRVKLAPADTKEREVLKIADEYLRPINQNWESIGSATNFTTYVNETYIPVMLPLMATSTHTGAIPGNHQQLPAASIREALSARSRKLTASKILQRDVDKHLGA